MTRPCPVPSGSGVYAWYFSAVPGHIETAGCTEIEGWKLLYVGISPKEPPTNGHAASRSNLRKRLLIPTGGDQYRWAQSRRPMDMMRQGCSAILFQASQQ